MKNIVFILNPISGTGDKGGIPAIIDREIDHSAYRVVITQSEYAGHAAEIATRSVADGADIVVAVGGDGTINEVARSLVHTRAALGIVPNGSGNGLARHLRIPMDIRKALRIINACRVEVMDYGVINDYPFFCTCGMGFDAFISLKFAESGRRGPRTYVENVLREGLKYKPETYEVTDDTGAHEYKAFLIACANASQYGNNAYIAPRATMTDGLMDVIIMEPFDVFDVPQLSIDMFTKTLENNSKIKSFRTKRIHIRRASPGAIHYDGDPVMTGNDIDVHIEERGIRIITNPDIIEDTSPANPLLNAFSVFYNNINNVREEIFRRLKIEVSTF